MEELTQEAAKIGITISASQQLLFSQLLTELKAWNEHTNLTAIREDSAIIKKHFLDSLSVLSAIPKDTKTLVDIGAGAGFPGLPLAIMNPNIQITLVESVAKKVAFIEHAIKTLDLKNAIVINARAEELSRNADFRDTFDVATARAVAELSTLVEYTLPFVRAGGVFIAQKKAGTEETMLAETAIKTLSGSITTSIPITIADLEPRQLILISKIKNTPKEFPRAFGLPSRKPL